MSNRIRRPTRSFGTVLKSGIIGKNHKWKTPNAHMPMRAKALQLQPAVWQQPKLDRSISFSKIVSANHVAPYYSSAATNYHQTVADLVLLHIVGKRWVAIIAWLTQLGLVSFHQWHTGFWCAS